MDSAHFWEDSNHSVTGIQHIKYERCSSADASRSSCKEEPTLFRYCEGNLNFSTAVTSEDDDFNFHKKKVSRDPMSHRIIEKRRRDRMNNCLADLSRLIPSEYLKKGRGRIEKTEIIEMAIKHMQYLQSHTCNCIGSCDMPQQNNNHEENSSQQTHSSSSSSSSSSPPIITEHYRLGYQECLSETMHFLVEVEGFFAGDTLCVQLINHLQKHCDKILKGDRLNFPRTNHSETTSMSSGSSGKGSHIPLGTSGVSSASPESGSCSDGSRTENKDSVVDSGHPPSAPISVSSATVYVEENSECEGLLNLSSQSQLREMLTASNTAIRTQQCDTISNRLQIVQTSISPQPLALGSNSPSLPSEIHEKDRSSASLYKFKNNIKQRFSEEHHTNGVMVKHNGFDVPRGYEEILKRKRYSLESNHENCETNHNTRHVLFKRNDSDTCSVSSLTPSPPPATSTKYLTVSSPDVARSPVPRHSLPASTTHGIPIFALDCRGSFYIPLTIEFDVLAPYLAAVGFNPASDVTDLSSVVLHPVTISVNFQQGIRHRMIQNVQQRPAHLNSHCAPSSPWRSETPSFSSVPKWTYSENS